MNQQLRNQIKTDIHRYYGKYEIPLKEKILPYNMGLKYIIVFRKANYYYHKKGFLKTFYRFKLRWMGLKLGFQVHPATQIGDGFYLGHIGNTVVNPKAVLGRNATLEQSVTIGMDFRGKRKGCPVIGDNVFIGANAVVVGKLTIGDNVVIAPNAFVNCDIPSNSIALGNPVKIIPKENASDGFIFYKV